MKRRAFLKCCIAYDKEVLEFFEEQVGEAQKRGDVNGEARCAKEAASCKEALAFH